MADDPDTIYRADGKPVYLWLNDGVLGAVKGYRTWVWQPGGPWVRYLFNPFTDGIVVTVQEALDNLRAAYEGGGTQPSPFDDGSLSQVNKESSRQRDTSARATEPPGKGLSAVLVFSKTTQGEIGDMVAHYIREPWD